MVRGLKFLSASALAALAIGAPGLALAEESYAALVRDILIARQCALADEIVESGFRLQVTALVERAVVRPQSAAAEREQGETEYRLTWRDHGAGPVDGRCRKQGAAIAARFRAYVMEE